MTDSIEPTISLQNILVNYYTFGSLLVTVLIGILSAFFLTLKDKTRATYHLGLACSFLTLFQLGYFLGAFYYHPIAAFHRWFTSGFILFGILHFGQFFYRFPEDERTRFTTNLSRILYAIGLVTVIWFYSQTYNAPKKYHFTAHHWDFNAEAPSRILSIVIVTYSIISFLILPGIKIYKLTKQKAQGAKRAISGMAFAGLLAAVIPNITNVMSRDGAIERSVFLTSLVLLFTLAFFMITIIFINTSHERTTFMVKIVGISMVTMLIIMQVFSYMTDQEKEEAFDNISTQKALRVLEGGEKSSDILYVIEYNPREQIEKDIYRPETVGIDLLLAQADMYNTYLYEEIHRLPTEGYKQGLLGLLEEAPEFFLGYKDAILGFIKEHEKYDDKTFKTEVDKYFQKLNRLTFVQLNKLSDIPPEKFCKEGSAYVQKVKGVDTFRDAILKKLDGCKWKGEEIEPALLKAEFLKHFRYYKPELSRIYRKDLDGFKHYVAFMKYNAVNKTVSEVGYNYRDYREYMHKSAKLEILVLGIVLFVLMVIFPMFFQASLVKPLYALLAGVEKVNQGNLDAEVPIAVNDEIGYLTDSFNGMVASIKDARRELQDYAENLEEKVKDRTKALQEKMDEVQRLKVQQDGDYFLTSLLAKPLFFNANKSKAVSTDFFVHQKKKFEFRNKVGDLGGDICVTGNLKLGKPDSFRRYTMVMNGDAMGKSMQGAGGSLVMGVAVNAIMARSAKRVMNRTPEEWLTDVYEEIHAVFKSFNGTMVLSATMMVIDDITGQVWYFNAEHPFSILYRDGKASFIESELNLRKLGLDSEFPFKVYSFQLEDGDKVILASDGRDDIDITPDESVRTINEDENLVLGYVEQAHGDIYKVEEILHTIGDLTDDLSFLSLVYKKVDPAIIMAGSSAPAVAVAPPKAEPEPEPVADSSASSSLDDDLMDDDDLNPEAEPFGEQASDSYFEPKTDDWDKSLSTAGAFEEGKILYQRGSLEKAIEVMHKAFSSDDSNPKLNKFLGLVSYKGKDYQVASEVLNAYLKDNEGTSEYWYYLSMSEKKLGNYDKALKAAQEALKLDSDNFQNLVNLADVSRLLGNTDRAVTYATRAQGMDPENKNVKKLTKLLEKATGVN